MRRLAPASRSRSSNSSTPSVNNTVPDPGSLIALARSDDEVLRRAALLLCDGNADEELLEALAHSAVDPASVVRQALAQALADYSWWGLDHVVARLLLDPDSDVRIAAVRAARWRPALEPRLVERLKTDDYWRTRQEIARALGHGTPRAVVIHPARRPRRGRRQRCGRPSAPPPSKQHLGALGGYPADCRGPVFPCSRRPTARVSRLRAGLCPLLLAWLDERCQQ